jgi:hypothetical protein
MLKLTNIIIVSAFFSFILTDIATIILLLKSEVLVDEFLIHIIVVVASLSILFVSVNYADTLKAKMVTA